LTTRSHSLTGHHLAIRGTPPPQLRWRKHCAVLSLVEFSRSHRVPLSQSGWSDVRPETIGCALGSPPLGLLGTRLGITAKMRRVTLLLSGLRPTFQSSSAYTHGAGRHQISNSILLSQVLAASLERSYTKGLEAIEKPLRSPTRCWHSEISRDTRTLNLT
jgi:hypothetical protein